MMTHGAPAEHPTEPLPASTKAASGSALTPPPTLLDSVLQSILTPGAGPGLVATINGALVALLVTLVGLAATGNADVHIVVMGCLALGLLASINLLVSQLRTAAAAGDGSCGDEANATAAEGPGRDDGAAEGTGEGTSAGADGAASGGGAAAATDAASVAAGSGVAVGNARRRRRAD